MVKLVTVHGMEQCKTDSCVFRLIREGKVALILTVHVDHRAVAGPKDEIAKPLLVLNEYFTTNDLGELSFFMECVLTQDLERGTLSIIQTALTETLVRRLDVATAPFTPFLLVRTRERGWRASRVALGPTGWL